MASRRAQRPGGEEDKYFGTPRGPAQTRCNRPRTGCTSASPVHPPKSLLTGFTGAKISGHRGYFLTNDGIDLNQALISYGLDFLRSRGYKKIQPPFMMNKDIMAKTAQLDQFDEELYKVRRTLNRSASQ